MTEVAQQSPPRRRGRSRKPLGDTVARRIFVLQNRLLTAKPHPEAMSALARLRRGIGRQPGFDYELDRYLGVPEELLGNRPDDDAEATDSEHAVHAAMTLFALHQQSRRERMHVDGRGFGTAIADLTRKVAGVDGVRRRFAALGTAATYGEALYHLRSLVVMLREQNIGIDYGLLADDVNTLRRPGGRAQIQSAWGREFFRGIPKHSDDTDAPEETGS